MEITIKIEGITLTQLERYRQLIHILLVQGVLNVRNGSAIIHFDHEGTLQEIEFHVKKYKRNRPSVSFEDFFNNIKVLT